MFRRNFKAHHRIVDENVIGFIDILIGTKTFIVVLILGRCIDPAALDTVKWKFFAVIRNDILSQFWSYTFKHIANMPNNGKVVGDDVFLVEEYIPNTNH